MSDLDIEMKEAEQLNFDMDSEYFYQEFQQAIDYLEVFGQIINDEDEYADYLVATQHINEYQNLVTIHKTDESFSEEVTKAIQSLQVTIIELSNKLQERMESIPLSEKKLISVKEFEKVYSISEESQRKLRKRLKDPLPFIQIEKRGNVLYNHKEVDKWFENYTREGK
jgi:hypothetical protein